MTKKEALLAELQNVVVTDGLVEKCLVDQGLNGSEDYVPFTDGKNIAICAINALQAVLSSQDIQEGGFSITMRSTVIPLRISALAKKWRLTDVLRQMNPTIKAVSRW